MLIDNIPSETFSSLTKWRLFRARLLKMPQDDRGVQELISEADTAIQRKRGVYKDNSPEMVPAE